MDGNFRSLNCHSQVAITAFEVLKRRELTEEILPKDGITVITDSEIATTEH